MKKFEVDEEDNRRVTPLPSFDRFIHNMVSDSVISLLTGAAAVLTVIVFFILVSSSGQTTIKQASIQTSKLPVPSGVQQNIQLSTIMNTQGCWRVCYKQAFADFTPSVDRILSKCHGEWLFFGALPASVTEGDSFTVGAFGEKSVALSLNIALTAEKLVTAKGSNSNDVYWYGTKESSLTSTVSRSIGFSSSDHLEVSAEDDTGFSTTCTNRLSFAFDSAATKKSKVTGAADCRLFKKDDSIGNEYHKVIMTNTCPIGN